MAEALATGISAVGVSMRNPTDVRAFIAFRRLMKYHHVDLVHTHSSIDSWLGALAAKTIPIPVVRSRHVSIPIRRTLVYRLADRVIASGEAVKAEVVQAGIPPSRVLSIPAGVDTTRFHFGVSGEAVRRELRLSGPTVGLVANIRSSKGHRFFLEAARCVLDLFPDVQFVIVGDGVGFDEVRREIMEMGLERHVLMTGFRHDIPEVMSALDVVTLPSTKSEGVSQVILQAMAVGTPVIASTVGGSPELIEDGQNGLLVPPQDPQALSEAIVRVFRDPAHAKEMARAAQRKVHALYTLDLAMEQVTRLYRELLLP